MVEIFKKPKVTDPIEIDVIEEAVKAAVEHEDYQEAAVQLQTLLAPDQADLIESMEPEEQDMIFPLLHPENSADILEELEDEEAANIASRQDVEQLAMIVQYMEPDEAADLIGDMVPQQANELLDAIPESDEVIPLLAYKDDSAGGLMTKLPVTIYMEHTVQEATEYLREEIEQDSEDIFYLYVIDKEQHLVGVISIRQMLLAKPQTLIKHIMDTEVIAVNALADQEEAARMMARYDLLALPVIDHDNHLLGLITLDDSVEVLEDEATEDIYRLGGVPQGAPSDVAPLRAMRTRLPWLVLNLLTAMASVTVLSLFEETIAKIAVLTAFFPIVAGVSGSAGTQTLTVTVRGLALGEIEPKNGLPTLLREVLIGLANGVAVGLIVAAIAQFWKSTPLLGMVVGVSTLINMIVAGIVGVLVPMLMDKLKFDPALASPILVTTLTDTIGYLVYLGFSTIILLELYA
ncbi:MAG: magnesium transporter [Anaerolineaceae bacterium]|nr:magnesium transporter [Anaerolineaceae bacterium]